MENQNEQTKAAGRPGLLIALCWLVYATSYIGKLSYNANINQIGEAFSVSYGEAGLVSTFFFFTYGIGQVINGLLCKKYNIKYVIFTSLIVSSVMNLLVGTLEDFTYIKYLWLINGGSMSFLWTSLIRLLSETLDKKDLGKATVVMGTTVATGTLIVYGISALFAATVGFRWTFYFATAIMATVAIVWLIGFKPLTRGLSPEIEEDSRQKSGGRTKGLIWFFAVMAVFAVSNNFTKDGLTAWTPDILSAIYETPGWLSILLTLLLPVLAVAGTLVATKVNNKTNNFIATCTIFFAISGVLITLVAILINYNVMPLTVGCFALVSCFMAGVNNVITSMVPLQMRERVNSGRLAGILNGFCYLGSTFSSYGLGAIADGFDWVAVFYVLIGVCSFAFVIGVVAMLVQFKKNNKV